MSGAKYSATPSLHMDKGLVMANEISTTKEKDVSATQKAIIKEAKRLAENCLHTSKSHFVIARYWTMFHLGMGIPATILAACAGTIAFASFQGHNTVAGIVSIVVTILTAVTTFLNPKECHSTHMTAGNNYDSLLTKARIFWTIDCRREDSVDILSEKLKDFSEQRDRFNRDYPQPPGWAYKIAKKGIEEGEADFIIDKEE